MKAMKKNRGEKKSYTMVEDNDPVGNKSGEAVSAKRAFNITAVQFPRYSPDLNPMDYFLWQEVEKRMAKNAPKRLESVQAFKARLKRTALAIPEGIMRKGVSNMKERVKNCFGKCGKHVDWN